MFVLKLCYVTSVLYSSCNFGWVVGAIGVFFFYKRVVIIIRIMADLMDEKVYLISSAEEGSICIVTLLLTGRATPNLHNGIVNIGDEQHYVSNMK